VADDKALVLFSGGQDSATCLAWALARFEHVETIGFDYGQRHRIELDVRPVFVDALRSGFPEWALRLGEDRVVDAGIIGALSDTALTRETEIAMQANGLPNTFVPGRNILFLTLAAAVAYRRTRAIPIAATTRSRRCRWR
jgi:7-cyano-7-deazaguanine synthase